MATERRAVQVCADWRELGGPQHVGDLHATPSRGKEVFSFEYNRQWLEAPQSVVLDPALGLYAGPQYPPQGRASFGVFLDSSPDRWGRVLLQRREAHIARQEERRPRPLLELDYLLGVYDGHRMGGLRFRAAADAPFLDNNEALASPPWTSLRELEHASLELEREGVEEDPAYGKWLQMLIAPGRSLGGARPKASVLDTSGHLWIAKFPSRDDTHDVGAWEGVVHALAKRAGVTTAEALTQRFASKHHTFLAKRFDRAGRTRIHFASAMTMLEREDGEVGASYLDIASVLMQRGSSPARDLSQLWRRIVFSMCVSNVDDHLRNHGFLLTNNGWELAPAYDMNPVAHGYGHTLNIDETDNAQSLELALAVAATFRIRAKDARCMVDEIVAAVRTWGEVATRAGISRPERERMAPAFRVADDA